MPSEITRTHIDIKTASSQSERSRFYVLLQTGVLLPVPAWFKPREQAFPPRLVVTAEIYFYRPCAVVEKQYGLLHHHRHLVVDNLKALDTRKPYSPEWIVIVEHAHNHTAVFKRNFKMLSTAICHLTEQTVMKAVLWSMGVLVKIFYRNSVYHTVFLYAFFPIFSLIMLTRHVWFTQNKKIRKYVRTGILADSEIIIFYAVSASQTAPRAQRCHSPLLGNKRLDASATR